MPKLRRQGGGPAGRIAGGPPHRIEAAGRAGGPRTLAPVSPRRLLHAASIAEAASWTLLIAGMILKYPLQGSGLLVSVAGSLHAVAFLGYLGCILLIGVDRRWSWGMLLLGAAASVPPSATLAFDRFAQRRGDLSGAWRLPEPDAERAPLLDRLAAWALRHPITLAAIALAAFVLILTGALSGALRSPH